jgi:sn-glycerol 3-phosphate transport system ATP-binding protein
MHRQQEFQDMADIAIRNVTKNYGPTRVIDGVDLTIRNGEFMVILGPSGCGKSTLLRMIAGLEGITGGTIAIAGDVVNDKEPRERGCAMVFQNYALYPHMTVAENIGYALKVAGLPKAERLAKVRAVAKTVGLDEYLDRKPGQLSGGQRQRVAMGRAMIREPKVFLFDEPLSNLDAKLRVQMRLEIRKLHQRLSATSVFVTHDQVEAMTMADRIVVMNKGLIEQIGTPDEIYEAPATLFVAGFIGSPPMNLMKARMTSRDQAMLDGVTLRTPNFAGLQSGASVMLGIRAEDVALRADGAHAMQVEFVERLGPVQLLHGRFADGDFIVQCDGSHAVAAGEDLRFDVTTQKIHAFDPATGGRLDELRRTSDNKTPIAA